MPFELESERVRLERLDNDTPGLAPVPRCSKPDQAQPRLTAYSPLLCGNRQSASTYNSYGLGLLSADPGKIGNLLFRRSLQQNMVSGHERGRAG